jgi:hypothetical protein
MAIIIEQILGQTDSGVRAIVSHADQKLDVVVAGSIDQIADALGKSITVELGFAAVVDWLILGQDSEPVHGLFQDSQNRTVRVVGRVHNVLPLDDGKALFDVYTRTGPEFVTFESTDILGPQPKLGDRIAATVRDLCFYPTWT